jgi:hypothetical protein
MGIAQITNRNLEPPEILLNLSRELYGNMSCVNGNLSGAALNVFLIASVGYLERITRASWRRRLSTQIVHDRLLWGLRVVLYATARLLRRRQSVAKASQTIAIGTGA